MNKVSNLEDALFCAVFFSGEDEEEDNKTQSMNGASLCNSVLLHSHSTSLSRFQSSSSVASSSYVYLSSTRSTYISISNRIRQSFRAVIDKRNDRFRSFAVKKRRNGNSELIESESSLEDDDEEEEEEDEDWGEFDLEAEGDEDEGEFLPMDKMKQWLERKPRGFGVGKKYVTSLEDKLLEEIEQSWKAQAANLNKLKNDPNSKLKRDDNLIKGIGETQNGFRVRVTNLPKKKNVHRDLKVAFKEVSGVLNIAPAVIGNRKTKDPICKGFALVDFKTEADSKRFVEQFNGERLPFGKVIKQIKCQVVEFSSPNESVSEEEYSDKGLLKKQELPGLYSEAVSKSDVVVEDDFSDDSDEEVDEIEMEEEEGEQDRISSSIETPIAPRRDLKTELRSQKPKQVVKREIREQEVLEKPLVSFQANSKSEEDGAETPLDDELDVDEEDGVEVADVDEEDGVEVAEPRKSSISSSTEERLERIRKLELKLLGEGPDSDQAKAKSASGEGKKKEKKKKKKKILVKGQAKKIEIPGSSKRLKVKEKALLTGVLTKYAAIAASTSNNE